MPCTAAVRPRAGVGARVLTRAGFPVKIKGVEGVVAVIVVSGLSQVEDHELLVEGVKWFLLERS